MRLRRESVHEARRRVRLTLGAGTACVVSMAIGLSGLSGSTIASADSGNSGNTATGTGASAAGVTPLLNMFEFGDTIGLPLACSDAGSVVSIIGAESDSSQSISPLVVQLDSQCSQLSSEGSGYLQQAIAESQGLALINPAVNPLIAALSGGLTTTGTQQGPALAPFGPTVAGLGGTVAFFEGT